jgi:SulP family sulfate permease
MGFTAGIAVIIGVSQLRDFFGLRLEGAEPIALWPKLIALWQATPTVDLATLAVGLAAIAIILIFRYMRPALPGFLIAVVLTSLATALFSLPVETIGSRFGALPSGLPWPSLPAVTVDRLLAVLPNAIAIALLGSIESLLSAVVADGMSGRRHRPGAELVAQGIANIGTAVFGGICATGTIARTATNVRAGAHGPVAGMLHAAILLAFLMIAAPLARHIPLAALAAILLIVAWNMGDWREIVDLARHNRGEAVVLAVTLLLTVFRDLTEGIVVGVALGSLLFAHRIAATVAVEDHCDENGSEPETPLGPEDHDVLIYRINGPLFFGAGTSLDRVMDRLGVDPGAVVIDLTAVPLIDASGADMLRQLLEKSVSSGRPLVFSGTRADVAAMLAPVLGKDAVQAPTVDRALTLIRAMRRHDPAASVPH